MTDKKKRNILIITLCVILVLMGTGYALLSQVLNITGTASVSGLWDVKITNIEPTTLHGTGTSQSATNTNDTASFTANLNKPGDYVEYTVTVANNGNIDAELYTLTTTPSSLGNPINNIIYSISDITQGDRLLKKYGAVATTIQFKIRATFDPEVTEMPESNLSANFQIVLNFQQCNECSTITDAERAAALDVFTVNAEGTITGYDATFGSTVSIPAEYDGIQIKKIGRDAFKGTVYTESIVYHANLENDIDYTATDVANDAVATYITTQPNANPPVIEYGVILNNDYSEQLQQFMQGMYTAGYIPSVPTFYTPENKPALQEGQYEIYVKFVDGELKSMAQKTIVAQQRLLVDSVDFSQATNLEEIEDTAFAPCLSKLNSAVQEYATLYEMDTTKCDYDHVITSLNFGNNNKEILIGNHSFANANLTNLTTYTTYKTRDLLVDSNDDSIPDYNFPISPFKGSHIDTWNVKTANNITEISLDLRNDITQVIIRSNDPGEVENLILHPGIVVIGGYAFTGTNANNVTLPNTLTTIGERAFTLNRFTSITIPSSVTLLKTNSLSISNLNITIKRPDSTGLTLETGWADVNATINYDPS